MGSELINRVLKKVDSLPPLPAAVQRLSRLTKETECNYDEIAEVISNDEVLTGKILRLSNSAFYGLSQRVGTVSQAIVVLGVQSLKNIALGVTVFGFRTGEGNTLELSREDLWRHSLTVASAARLLAMNLQIQNWEEAFSGGMMHDLGKIIFIECFPREYSRILEQALSGHKTLQTLEQETFGIHSAALGGEIGRKWKLPASLTRAISRHHLMSSAGEVPSEPERLAHSVALGDHLSRIARMGSDGDPHINLNILSLMEAHHISNKQLCELLETLPGEIQKAETFFELPASDQEKSSVQSAPLTAGVLLSNQKHEKIVGITLLARGCHLVSRKELENPDSPLGSVISDESLPSDLKTRLKKKEIPLLDFSRWQKENEVVGEPDQLNLVRLHSWLDEELNRTANQNVPEGKLSL